MRRWPRRHRPSQTARHRLASAIRRNRAELEVQVAEGLLRSELYLETGHAAEAAEVLEEQRRRVTDFEGRVQRALAAAATEADAEAVLAGASGVDVLHAHALRGPSRLPQLIAAAIAVVLSAAIAGAWQLSEGTDGVPLAVRIDATDQPRGQTSADPASAGGIDRLSDRRDGTEVSRPGPLDETAARDRWTAERTSLLERLGAGLRVRPDVLRELEGLVSSFVPAGPLTEDAWLQLLTETVTDTATEDPDEREAVGGDDEHEERSSTWFGEEGEDERSASADESTSTDDEAGTDPAAPTDDGADEPADDEEPDGSTDTWSPQDTLSPSGH